MDKFIKALNEGKETRKLQDDCLELFVQNIQRITDKDVLENVKESLIKGGVK